MDQEKEAQSILSAKKRSKTDNEVLLPARESMKRPLTPFFPLPRRPSLRNTRLSDSRASTNIKIVALDNDFIIYRSSTFGQASITKAGTSWKWEERSQGPFHGLTSGKQNFIVCF